MYTKITESVNLLMHAFALFTCLSGLLYSLAPIPINNNSIITRTPRNEWLREVKQQKANQGTCLDDNYIKHAEIEKSDYNHQV